MATTFTGTAQAGTSTTITLAALSSPATDDLIQGQLITITTGTGAGQSRQCYLYRQSTKVATVWPAWKVSPDATSVYNVDSYCFALGILRVGLAQAGGGQTITLDAGAPATNSFWGGGLGGMIFIVGGTGAGQSANIASYVGSTQVVTIIEGWATNPDATSVFVIMASDGAWIPPNGLTDNSISSGAITASSFTAGSINAAAIASNAFTAAKFAAACLVSGSFDRSTTITAAANSTLSAATATTATSAAITTVATNLYAGMEIYIFSGTGIGQSRTIISHTSGTTPVYTIDRPWITNPASGSGYQIRPCSNIPIVTLTGTASAGTSTTLTSNTVTTVVANQYAGQVIYITLGTAIGQVRTIISHTSGTTPIFTVDRAWATNPVSTDQYQIFPESAFQLATDQAATAALVFSQTLPTRTAGTVAEQLIQPINTVGSGTNGATTFSTNLGTPSANAYANQWLFFTSGTLLGQSQQVLSNDTSGNITMAIAYTAAPSSTDKFIIVGK